MLSFLAGLLAGATHVIMGPDHWVAVTPLSVAQPERALRVGIRWGLGHALGILLLGAVGLILRDLFSLDRVSSLAEGSVGVVLVISGLWALRRSRALVIHSHPHVHQSTESLTQNLTETSTETLTETPTETPTETLTETATSHNHVHLHVGDTTHERDLAHRAHSHAAFGFGVLHGMAGASQLWALIPTLALPIESAISYLSAFLISSVLTMGGFTYVLGRWANRDHLRLDLTFKVIGWGSIILGVYWASLTMFTAS